MRELESDLALAANRALAEARKAFQDGGWDADVRICVVMTHLDDEGEVVFEIMVKGKGYG